MEKGTSTVSKSQANGQGSHELCVGDGSFDLSHNIEAFKNKIDLEIKELMDVDMPPVKKAHIQTVIRQLSRKELEDIILKKIVEVINSESAIGILRNKILSLCHLKDKLFSKISTLGKQVSELDKAMKSIVDNETRNPKSRPQPPVRFYRSVGLQVSLEPKVHIAGANKPNELKNCSSTTLESSPVLISNKDNFESNADPLSSPPAKRAAYSNLNATAAAATEMSKKLQTQMNKPTAKNGSSLLNVLRQRTINDIRKKGNPAYQAPSNGHTGSAAAFMLPNENNSATDLTIDGRHGAPPQNVIMGQNAVQCTMLNNCEIQLVTSPYGGYQFIQSQPSPFILVPQHVQAQNSSLTSQFGNPNYPVQIVQNNNAPQQPVFPPQNNIMGNLGGANDVPMNATVPVVPSYSLRSNINPLQNKFTLPPLPPPNPETFKFRQVRRVKEVPSKPELLLEEKKEGIVLSWTLNLGRDNAEVESYQIFACQDSLRSTSRTNFNILWKSVGQVKALPLPMVCTLSEFVECNRYYFIVRGVDVYNRTGPFCDPVAIVLKK